MSKQPNWPEMLATLEAELLEWERISLDPETEPDAQLEAAAHLREGIPLLREMKTLRGFVPGRVRL